MDAAFGNLYHPKGKCLLNHREPAEDRGSGEEEGGGGRGEGEGAVEMGELQRGTRG